jgi:hypothetical protein
MVMICAVALGVGNVALAGSTVTQHEARPSDALGEITVVETVVSEPADAVEWFPTATEDPRLALVPSPVASVSLDPSATLALTPTGGVVAKEYTVIPLPPAAWSGLVGLGSLATYSWRRTIKKFFS